MAIRDDLVDLVDDLRREVVDEAFGLRLDTISTRMRRWPGRVIGKDGVTPIDVDTELDPKPKARRPSPRMRFAEPGKYEAGDVVVEKISATYTEEQLTGGVLTKGYEFFWVINGEPYQVMGADKKYLSWSVHLRRCRNIPTG